MFISKLNVDQQSVLLKLANEIMEADGVSRDEEKLRIDMLIAQCDEEAKRSSKEVKDLGSLFDTQESKIALLLELLGVALSDGSFHKSEKTKIKEIANSLGVDSLLLDDMESWVLRQLSLVIEANRFMEDA